MNIWDKYDIDKSGELDRVETKLFLTETMDELIGNKYGGIKISDKEFQNLFNIFDIDNSGTIDKQEMVGFIKNFF